MALVVWVPLWVPLWCSQIAKLRQTITNGHLRGKVLQMTREESLRDDARVAELVDAHDSGSCPSNGVQVQLLPRAPSTLPSRFKHFRQLVQ